jgi:hypothetical protein
MSEEIFFSKDDDFWENASTDLFDPVNDVFQDSSDLHDGSVITVYKGLLQKSKASDHLPSVAESMIENAYDNIGECAESWFSNEDCLELQDAVSNFVDEWMSKRNLQPSFGLITEVQPVNVKINADGDRLIDFEVISSD